MTERETGTVTHFNDEKGFGFIQRPGAEDIFVHHSELDGEGRRSLVPGQSVEFEAEDGDRGPRAVRVTGSVSAEPAEEREMERDSGLLARTVYVGNLCYGTSDTELCHVFEGAGEVDKIMRITDREGNPRRYAFVQMKDERAVQKAIKKLGGVRVQNRAMTVARAKPSSPGRGRGRPNMRRKV